MIRKQLLALFFATLAAGLAPCSGFAFDVAATQAAAEAQADKDASHLFAVYKDLHEHPELGYQEKRTAALLAREMRALGFSVTEGVGKTGIVALYKNGAGPVVLVRTDIDALPIQEETGLPYASHVKQITRTGRESFVFHGCGHDTHMATWLGTAKALLAMKDRWHGTLMFIGQPAEEGGNGAKAMIDDGLFTRFPRPDFAFGLHNSADPFGVYYKPGVASSSVDDFQIVFHGRSSHGSRPNMGIDPVLMAARFAIDVQAVISREKDPAAFGVIAVGSIDSGPLGNGTPDKATVRGATRAQDTEVREKLLAGILRTAKAEADMAAAPAPPDVELRRGYTMIVNDAALTEKTAAVFRTAFGADTHELLVPETGSEDFSEYGVAGVPSFYFRIGAYDPQRVAEAKQKGEVLPVHHSSKYLPAAQEVIRTGTQAMTLAVVNAMQTK